MNHPTELLTEYVDGTLPERERAVVADHLAGCTRCRAEVADAERAREALRGLPRPEAPPGLARHAITAAAVPAGPGRWARAGGLAAAAALVILLAVSLPRLFGESDSAPAAMDAEAAASGLGRLEGELDETDLEALAQERSTLAVAAAPEGGTFDEALRCLRRGYREIRRATPVRLVDGSFKGVAAYIGVFEQGPGAGQPPDTRIALAVASADCSILSYTSATIPAGE